MTRTTAAPAILPTGDELEGLVLTPSTITWQRASDARTLSGAGAALLLQVAHPTVGAGVAEHSNFKQEPWQRLWRTLDFVNLTVYGGDAAVEVGRRVREMHKSIKGTKPDGERYHALEPEAYAWVHGTLAYTIVEASRLFGRPFARHELEQFYAEWRGLGRFLGVRDRDLPPTWPRFMAWFDEIVDERLERTETVDDVVATLDAPAAPPGLPPALWRVLRIPPSRAMRLSTAGILPERLRPRLGFDWGAAEEYQLRAMGAVSRSLTPVMPRGMRNFGPVYLKWRSRQIEQGHYKGLKPGGGRELGAPA